MSKKQNNQTTGENTLKNLLNGLQDFSRSKTVHDYSREQVDGEYVWQIAEKQHHIAMKSKKTDAAAEQYFCRIAAWVLTPSRAHPHTNWV